MRIVVVDDGSDPPVKSCVPRGVEYVRLERTGGVQRARNLGLQVLGREVEFALFSDSDVVWKPGSIAAMVETLRGNPEAAYCYGNYEMVGADRMTTFVSGRWNARRLMSANFISTMSLVRMEALPETVWVEDEERLQDWSLWLRLLGEGKRGVWLNRVLFVAYYDAGSISLRGPDDYARWKREIRRRYVG